MLLPKSSVPNSPLIYELQPFKETGNLDRFHSHLCTDPKNLIDLSPFKGQTITHPNPPYHRNRQITRWALSSWLVSTSLATEEAETYLLEDSSKESAEGTDIDKGPRGRYDQIYVSPDSDHDISIHTNHSNTDLPIRDNLNSSLDRSRSSQENQYPLHPIQSSHYTRSDSSVNNHASIRRDSDDS
ncbi:hypothetical protein K493DRAFT_375397 [Basidiobolus meristosporus CBS 931.73]|uniref:Uncharacterized protein n=1 Tax=Basidiobolus meristosporus CBS 931.73 TaxID=1314790 RepID=A0A1Y1Z5F8_9FUNG|nr:hypothetical protein K493DRAFT_375397 [Basidiobolus meristosporus CBS 931.73]|eukprot:ORY05532.1 hypothetical protein K493DRAFT_375397 [Basidiobolus meristosporus CBS 931.73]